MSTRGREFINVFLGEPDHMHQHRFRAKQSDAFGIIDGREAILLLEEELVGFDFGEVHGDPHAALASKLTHLTVELIGNATRGARAKPDMYTLIGGSLPLAMHLKHTEQTGFAALNHTWMHGIALCGIGANVHHDTSQASSNTAFIDHLSDAVKAIAMGKHRFEKGSRARLEDLGNAETGAHISILFGEIALQHPDTLTEPLDQRHIVRTPANQRLGKMHMRIDQPRNDQFPLQVHYFVPVKLP